MSTTQDTRPICGMCIVSKRLRPRMYEIGPDKWRCPVCSCVTIHPTDADKTAADLAVMFKESSPEEIRARNEREAAAYDRKPRVYHGGPVEIKPESKSGRRKKPTKPYRWYRDFGEV